MAQWGLTDNANNTPIWSAVQLGKDNTRAAANVAFGNTTANAYFNNARVGVYGVAAAEATNASGNIAFITVTNAGSGYTANAVVTITGDGADGAANAQSNATGRIAAVNIVDRGEGYTQNPTVVIAAPTAITFNANTALFQDATFYSNTTGVANTTEFITTTTAHGFANNTRVKYIVPASNTAVSGLTNNAFYYVVSANSTAFKLSETLGGSAVNITSDANDEEHTVRRVDFIEISSNVLQNGDKVTYKVAASNTAISGLANNTQYFVVDANSSGVHLSTTVGGSRIALVTPGASETGHSLTGETATAIASVNGGREKGTLAGWNIRTELSNGRVRWECLVATKNITSDAGDDAVLPE